MGIESTSPGYEDKLKEWGVIRAVSNGAALTAEAIDELKYCIPSPTYTLKSWSVTNDSGDTIHKTNENALSDKKLAYWARPVLLPIVQRTLNSFEGMIWAQEPEIELPTALEPSAKALRDVSQAVTNELLGAGRCGVLVDMPSEMGSKADKLAAYPVMYRPEQIFFWRCDANGKLLEVRLLEGYEEPVGDEGLDWEYRDQIHRLFINADGNYESQIYRGNEIHGDPVIPTQRKSPMKHIPFHFGGADENSTRIGQSPMYLMSRINLALFRLDADDRDNLHYHGQAMTVVQLGDQDTAETFLENNGGVVDTGASGLNIVSQGGDIKYSQIDASGAIGKKMDTDLQNAIACGAQLVKSAGDTATLGSREMEYSASTSTLKKVARNQSELMTAVVGDMCDFMNIPRVDYMMKPTFVTDNVDAQILQQAMIYVTTLGFPMDVAIEAAKKAGLHDLSTEDMKDKIEAEPPIVIPSMTAKQAAAQAELEASE